MENKCVCCGADIPEGWQVCPNCDLVYRPIEAQGAKIYNKLVRDKIPEIIAGQGKSCITRTLGKCDYLIALYAKLQEEVNEYLESGDIEELADIEEVLRAILAAKNISYKRFDKIRKAKARQRGGFKKRVCLVSVSKKERVRCRQWV